MSEGKYYYARELLYRLRVCRVIEKEAIYLHWLNIVDEEEKKDLALGKPSEDREE